MPLVSSFDGENRRVFLDASIAGTEWSPLEMFREYLAYRRDNHQFRGFSPLMRMRGGEPKGGGKFAPRFLQLLTDTRGLTTKLVLPDTGPYRTTLNLELATDVADVDPEPFDVSGLSSTGIIVDYKPPEAEVIQIQTGSGLTFEQAAVLDRILRVIEGDEELNPTTGKAYIRDKVTKEVLVEKDGVPSDAGSVHLIEVSP